MKQTNQMGLRIGTAFLTITLFTSGCGENDKSNKGNSNVISTSAQMDSEELSLAGEQLVGPFTFMLAHNVFEQALKKNPDNQRALFYKTLLKPFMLTQGLANRILPLIREFGSEEEFHQTLNSIPDSPFKTFITEEGGDPIFSTEEAQAYLTKVRDSWNSFRTFLRSTPDMEMKLNLNPHVFKDLIRRKSYNSCRVLSNWNHKSSIDGVQIANSQTSRYDDKYFDYECDPSMMAKVGVNIADMKVLQQFAAGMVLYLTPFTSYKVDGLKSLIKINMERKKKHIEALPSHEAQALLEANSEFGKLRNDHSMRTIIELGSDFSAAWRFANNNQQTLCPSTASSWELKRPHMLAEQGICVGNIFESRNRLELFDSITAGMTRQVIRKANGEEIETSVDPMAIFRTPTRNLRDLAPASYDDCGKPKSLRSQTFGGVLPEGNAQVMRTPNSCNSGIY